MIESDGYEERLRTVVDLPAGVRLDGLRRR